MLCGICFVSYNYSPQWWLVRTKEKEPIVIIVLCDERKVYFGRDQYWRFIVAVDIMSH